MFLYELLCVIILLLLHLARAILNISRSLLHYLRRQPEPQPLGAERRRVPKHLAVCFQDARREDSQVLLKSCVSIEGWARQIGIKELSFYDRKGILQLHETVLRELLPASSTPISTPPTTSLDIELPLTPPTSSKPTPPSSIDGLSDSETPSKSALRNRRKSSSSPLGTIDESFVYPPPKVYILSYDQSKPLVAQAAQWLAARAKKTPSLTQKISVADIDDLVKASFPSPDIILIHPTRPVMFPPWSLVPRPLELDGFPAWHMDLSELHYEPSRARFSIPRIWHGEWTQPGIAVEESELSRMLESYGNAESRKGR